MLESQPLLQRAHAAQPEGAEFQWQFSFWIRNCLVFRCQSGSTSGMHQPQFLIKICPCRGRRPDCRGHAVPLDAYFAQKPAATENWTEKPTFLRFLSGVDPPPTEPSSAEIGRKRSLPDRDVVCGTPPGRVCDASPRTQDAHHVSAHPHRPTRDKIAYRLFKSGVPWCPFSRTAGSGAQDSPKTLEIWDF